MPPAIRYAENLAEVSRRGARIRYGARLLLVRCTACGVRSLFDEDAERLYVDPDDLGRAFDDSEVPPCRECKRAGWEFEDVPAEALEDLTTDPWAFCFWSPRSDLRPSGVRRALALSVVGLALGVGVVSLVFNPDPLASPDRWRPGLELAGVPR